MNTAWDYSSHCIKMFVILVCGHARRGLSFQPCWFSSWVSWHLLFSSWEPKPGSVWLKDSLSFPLRGASAPFSKGVRHGHGTPGRSASGRLLPLSILGARLSPCTCARGAASAVARDCAKHGELGGSWDCSRMVPLTRQGMGICYQVLSLPVPRLQLYIPHQGKL